VFKGSFCKWFGKNVCNIVRGSDASNVCESLHHNVLDGVVFYIDVFDICVMGMVLSKKTCHVIITVEQSAVGKRFAQALKQFTEKNEFFPSMM
jgi:hypothetical protein